MGYHVRAMSLYETNDGASFLADTAAGVVSQLRGMSRAPAMSDEKWMADCSIRTLIQTGTRPRTSSPEAFVTDLLKLGLLVEIQGN